MGDNCQCREECGLHKREHTDVARIRANAFASTGNMWSIAEEDTANSKPSVCVNGNDLVVQNVK
ncbi:hypothetical protein KIN20_017403 [Parelaphostrongylus tenuis]|uniref:Uncharacterized protein n=1 Tax=Parelaphostrongylus tenuis TaxID=148309 RepID=A0AAD5MHX0_PARTN|nr:hypothetical protein KIN20_017403 [Parelaphostrongylus tenuis]